MAEIAQFINDKDLCQVIRLNWDLGEQRNSIEYILLKEAKERGILFDKKGRPTLSFSNVPFFRTEIGDAETRFYLVDVLDNGKISLLGELGTSHTLNALQKLGITMERTSPKKYVYSNGRLVSIKLLAKPK
jgi:hypothetical protein